MRKLRTAIAALLSSPVAHNSAALYGVQVCRKFFPLITVPYLARTLHADGWGRVALVLSLGELVALIVEFGFNLSATREISRDRFDTQACGKVMAGVLGAQSVLGVLGVTLALVAIQFIPLLRGNPKLVLAGLLYALAQGFAPLWFFQGLERMRLAAALEVTAKCLMLAGIFLLVRTPEDAWKVVALQGSAAGVSTIGGLALAFRSFPFRVPTPSLVIGALRRGWPMFLFRSAESLYGVGNCFVLGLFATPAIVGYFAASEKISKAVFGLLNPIREALYPRLSYLMTTAKGEAAKLARTGIVLMTAAGAALSACLMIFAPQVIRLVAGPEFAPAVPVLRLLAALPFVLSITYSVGLQWLLPLGRDKTVYRIIIGGAALNLSSAFLFASRFDAMGMAVSVVSAELLVCTAMVWVVGRSTDLLAGLFVPAPSQVQELL